MLFRKKNVKNGSGSIISKAVLYKEDVLAEWKETGRKELVSRLFSSLQDVPKETLRPNSTRHDHLFQRRMRESVVASRYSDV